MTETSSMETIPGREHLARWLSNPPPGVGQFLVATNAAPPGGWVSSWWPQRVNLGWPRTRVGGRGRQGREEGLRGVAMRFGLAEQDRSGRPSRPWIAR